MLKKLINNNIKKNFNKTHSFSDSYIKIWLNGVKIRDEENFFYIHIQMHRLHTQQDENHILQVHNYSNGG